MQSNPQLSPQSHFDSIFNFVCPAGQEKPMPSNGKGLVYDIFFECTTDHIRVDLDLRNNDMEDVTETMYINHMKFLPWVQKKGLLEFTTGSNHMEGGDIVEDEESAVIGYDEFCMDHLTAQDIADYLKEMKIVNHDFQLS